MGVGIRLVEGWKQAIYNSSKLFNIWEGDVRGKLLSRVNVEARSAFTLFLQRAPTKHAAIGVRFEHAELQMESSLCSHLRVLSTKGSETKTPVVGVHL